MATSGTIDTTVISTDVVLAHAMRRCGVSATGQTPEIVEIAQECLFMLLLSLASRGINLWCVDKKIIESIVGKKTYVLPAGTLSLLNVAYSTCTYVTGTDTTGTDYYQIQLATAGPVVRMGITLSTLSTSDTLLQFSDDGITWTTSTTVTTNNLPTVNVRGWFDMNITGDHTYYRAYGTALVASEVLLVSTISDLPITPMNRDDYTALPIKDNAGSPAVNYFFEKLVAPTITLWPVPNVANNQFCIWRHRQVQDVGTLTQQLELPNRWYESITWQLSGRLCFELPEGVVSPTRVQMVMGMLKDMQIEVEHGESDDSPTFLAPNISVYTR